MNAWPSTGSGPRTIRPANQALPCAAARAASGRLDLARPGRYNEVRWTHATGTS
jgi:hypothetical protein